MPKARARLNRLLNTLSWLAFSATIILIPFRLRFVLASRPVPPVWRDYTDFLLFASDIAVLLTIAPWLLRLRLEGRRISFSPKLIIVPLIGLTVVGALSSINSVDPLLSLYHSLRLVILFAFVLFVINEVRDLSQLAKPLAIQIAIQSGVAIAQVQLQSSVGLEKLGEYQLDPAWNGVSIVLTDAGRFLRAYGLSDHPNILGGCLAFGLIFLFVYISGRERAHPAYWTIFAAGCLALFVTFSRSAWLGFALAIGLCLVLLRRSQPKYWQRGLLLSALGVALIAPWAWQYRDQVGIRLGGGLQGNPSEFGSVGERRYLGEMGTELFVRHPITGVGLGAMPVAFAKEFPNFSVSYQPAHFVILEIAAETGLLGATFFFVLLALPCLVLWQKRNMPLSPGFIGAFGLLLSITVVGFLDYYPWLLAPGRLWLWFAWGLWGQFYTATPVNA